MSVLFAGALVSVVAGFLVERRLMTRDMQAERRDWTLERAALVNREPVRPAFDDRAETFQPPVDDEAYWTPSEN